MFGKRPFDLVRVDLDNPQSSHVCQTPNANTNTPFVPTQFGRLTIEEGRRSERHHRLYLEAMHVWQTADVHSRGTQVMMANHIPWCSLCNRAYQKLVGYRWTRTVFRHDFDEEQVWVRDGCFLIKQY